MIEWATKTDKIGNCDECGNTVPCIYNFCPWCGIKLEKEIKKENHDDADFEDHNWIK